jgi:hypothetical protein
MPVREESVTESVLAEDSVLAGDVNATAQQWRGLTGMKRVTATEISKQLVARHASAVDAWASRPEVVRLSKSAIWSKNQHNHSAPGLMSTGSFLTATAREYEWPQAQETPFHLSFDPDFIEVDNQQQQSRKTPEKELAAAMGTRRRYAQSRTAMKKSGVNLTGVCKACGDMVGDCEACRPGKPKIVPMDMDSDGKNVPVWSIQKKLNLLNERFVCFHSRECISSRDSFCFVLVRLGLSQYIIRDCTSWILLRCEIKCTT